MRSLISNLLELSRVNFKETSCEPISLHEVLTEVMSDLDTAISEARASVTHTGLPVVLGEKGQLHQLFQNLLTNAIKFGQPGAIVQVHISASCSSGTCTVSVRDNGIGIDPKYHGRIFGIFQKLHSSGEYSGSGIGLAICKKIVERHKGTISLESEPGKGSSFSFTLSTATPRV